MLARAYRLWAVSNPGLYDLVIRERHTPHDALLEVVDAPPPDLRHTETLDRLRAGDATLDLPGRLSLFGHTRLPVTEVELLRALADAR